MAMNVDNPNAPAAHHHSANPRLRGRLGGSQTEEFAAHDQRSGSAGNCLDEFPPIAHRPS
jgi:hypothetical protein